MAVVNTSESDGSQYLLHSIKNKFSDIDGWTDKNFVSRLGEGVEKVREGSAIVLVDDFIGTGNTIRNKVNWIKEKISERSISAYSIYICSIAAMTASKSILESLTPNIFVSKWLNKGISDYYNTEALSRAIEDMKLMEDCLHKEYGKRKFSSFGYGQSEALFYMEPYNIPNNVFPVFWWPFHVSGKKRSTLFTRLG